MRNNTSKWHVAEVQVSYKPTPNPVVIHDTEDAHLVLRYMWDKNLLHIQEQFCVLFLNHANHVLGFRCLHTGTIGSATIDLRLLFGMSMKMLASGIIISHNHPTGSKTPSKGDIGITSRIEEMGRILDIKLIDHIILAGDHHYSFVQNKLIHS